MEPTSKKTSRTSLSLFFSGFSVPRSQQSCFDTHYFDPTISEIRSLCYWIFFARAWQVKMWSGKKFSLNWLAGLSQEKQILFVVRKKSYSEAGRRHLWRFVSVDKFFVRVETSRSHLAWSTDDRNLTDFLVIKTNLSKFCAKCDLVLSPQYNAPWSPLFFLTLGVSEGGRA